MNDQNQSITGDIVNHCPNVEESGVNAPPKAREAIKSICFLITVWCLYWRHHT